MPNEKWQRAIDKQIEEARRQGHFDNLPGKGKPLNLDRNPHEDPGLHSAYKILKDNDYTLPWIAERKKIDAGLQEATLALDRSWRWYQHESAAHSNDTWIEKEWQRAMQQFRDAVQKINQLISTYNLNIPHVRFERPKIDPEREIEKIIRSRISGQD